MSRPEIGDGVVVVRRIRRRKRTRGMVAVVAILVEKRR